MDTSLRARVFGYALLAWITLSRCVRMRERILREQMHRHVFMIGITALPVTGGLAAITGALAITQVLSLAGTDSDITQQWLFYGLFFELAPLLSALVVVARSSAAMATELGIMRSRDEFNALKRVGIPAVDYLLLPRIWAFAVTLPAVTVFFQVVAILSGWIAVVGMQNQSLDYVVDQFLGMAEPALVLASIGKSAMMGILTGLISCHHGIVEDQSEHAIPNGAIHAVGNALVGVFLVDVLVGLAVIGLRG